MSRREHYPAGVPCFVDTLTEDVSAAQRFYSGVFGWEFTGPGQIPGDPPGDYFVAQSSGVDVAGLGSLPGGPVPGGQAPPAWNTHISVQSADDAAARAQAAGGAVVVASASAAPAGRIAVLTDPAGAAFCVWEAGQRAGAGRVNEPSAWAMSMLTTGDPARAVDFYGELFGWHAEAFAAAGGDFWLWRLPGFVGDPPFRRAVLADPAGAAFSVSQLRVGG